MSVVRSPCTSVISACASHHSDAAVRTAIDNGRAGLRSGITSLQKGTTFAGVIANHSSNDAAVQKPEKKKNKKL